MIQGAQQSGGTTPAIRPMRTLVELGEEETRRGVEPDLILRLSFPVDPRWYERYWYSYRAPSKRSRLANTMQRSGGEARVSKAICDVVARLMRRLSRLAGTPGKVRTSGSRV